MNNKVILAVAAVALLSAPAYAAASQIVVPGVTEDIVEGHTVFAVIEKAVMNNTTIEAAAVAVLVRERAQVNENFKGVLWFNDQYLVSPYAIQRNNVRHPCGGAVLAVNEGDPDPRTMLISKDDNEALGTSLTAKVARLTTLSGDQHDVIQIIRDSSADNQDLMDMQTGGSWLDVDFDTNTISSSTPTAVLDYMESYLITDPNDHTWIVDKYLGITTIAVGLGNPPPVPPAPTTTITTVEFPIWVVNILGKPVFVPDEGTQNCAPFVDDPWDQSQFCRYGSYYVKGQVPTSTPNSQGTCQDSVNNRFVTVDQTTGRTLSSGPGAFGDPNNPIAGLDAKPPALGYYEPTDPATNGGASYCYDGNTPYGPNGVNVGREPGSGCRHGGYPGTVYDYGLGQTSNTLRRYNAVLYFYLGPDDVRITATAPHGDTDTNGCESTPTYNDGSPKPPTEWLCPGGNDNAEGNSHPFNPPGIYVPQTWNPTTAPPSPLVGGYWVDIWSANRECSTGYAYAPGLLLELGGRGFCNPEEHATHNRGRVDLYFSGTARPLEPPARFFQVIDWEGRTDQFHENNQPQPRLHPGNAPPQQDFDPVDSIGFSGDVYP